MRHSERRGHGGFLHVSRARGVQRCHVAGFDPWCGRSICLRSVSMSMVLVSAHSIRWLRISLMGPIKGNTRSSILLSLESLENVSRMRAIKTRTRPVSRKGTLSARTQSFALDSRRRSKGTRLLSGHSNDVAVNVDLVLILVSTYPKDDTVRMENLPRF